jgi:hypothetical protein
MSSAKQNRINNGCNQGKAIVKAADLYAVFAVVRAIKDLFLLSIFDEASD